VVEVGRLDSVSKNAALELLMLSIIALSLRDCGVIRILGVKEG